MKIYSKGTILFKEQVLMVITIAVVIIITLGNIASSAGKLVVIPVPINIIYSGQLINASLLMGRDVPANYVKRVNVLVKETDIIGKVARRTLLPNKPIFMNFVVTPDVISVNRPTIMEYSTGMLKITAEVIPLASAKEGELVRARNIHSGTIVSGIAMANGTILARFPK